MMDSTEKVLSDLSATENRIFKIKSEIDQFDQFLGRVASGNGDNKLLNEKYHNLILSTKDISVHLSTIQKAIEFGSQIPDLRARARNLNTQAIAQLRRLQKLGVDVQRYLKGAPPYLDKSKPALIGLDSDEFGFSGLQKQKQVSSLDESAIDEERAREMEQLECDIVQVNELFTTLATYVHDQGGLVDSIDQNIEVAYEQVHCGTEQLTKATKHRTSARRKKCICIILTLVILLILGLALGLSLKSN